MSQAQTNGLHTNYSGRINSASNNSFMASTNWTPEEKAVVDHEERYNPKTSREIFSELSQAFTQEQVIALNTGLQQMPLWIPAVMGGDYTQARLLAQYLVQAEVITQAMYDIIDSILPLVR